MAGPPNSRRHKFSREEDDRLRDLIVQFGNRDWASICNGMPGRSARQCRHRYNNYLVETHQYLAWTDAEEELIFTKFQELGPKWVTIAVFLPGRTGNDVKNRWHKHIAKRYIQNDPAEPNSGTKRFAIEHGLGESDTPPSHGKPAHSTFLRAVLN
jgi:hypothetical protein